MTRIQLAAVAVMAGSQMCAAGVTYTNLGPGGTYDTQYRYSTSVGIFPDYRAELAWRFVAGESGRLDAARLGLYREFSSSQVVLSVYEDLGSNPGALMKAWTVTLPNQGLPAGQAWELALVDGPWVQAGGSYYLSVRVATSTSNWQWFSAPPGANGQFPLSRLGQRPGTGGPWDMFEPSGLPAFELRVNPCGTADFDGDGDVGTDADIEAYFACLAGNCCTACFPGGADFNGDGDSGRMGISRRFSVCWLGGVAEARHRGASGRGCACI